MKLLFAAVAAIAVFTVYGRDVGDEPEKQVKSAKVQLLYSNKNGNGGMQHSLIGPRKDQQMQKSSLVRKRRRSKCKRMLGGKCVPRRKSCPSHLPLEKPRGRPYCKRRSRCCYQVEVSDCDPACQNGGTCNEAGKCDCPPGWIGDACDIVSECGRVNRKFKIVNGTETEMHEYPWQVILVFSGTTSLYCGGSLINDRWVLTAAHCTEDRVDLQIILGNHLNSEVETAEIRINIKTINDHPNYEANWNTIGTGEYDFSLLELETALDLASVSPEISPVCLPNADNPSQYDHVSAITSGWGAIYYGGPSSDALLDVTVQTMTNTKCNDDYEYNGVITDNMICAAKAGKDSCSGDSGGPLVTEVDGYYNLIGVVSFGWGGCADPRYPGVYGRVTYVLPWIMSTIS